MEDLRKNEELTQEEREEKIEAYVAQHPDAEVNPDRAEHMAYGSKHFEERLVHASKMAKLSARRDSSGLNSYREQNTDDLKENHPSLYGMNANNRTERLMAEARIARTNADGAASLAGDQYDREQKNEVDDEVDGLMSGKSAW